MRRFEKGSRYWEITLDGQAVATRSGTLTGTPRTSRKRYPSTQAALREIDKRVAARMAESGWIEVLPPFEGAVDLAPRITGLDPDAVARRRRRPDTLAVDGDAAATVLTQRIGRSRERFEKAFAEEPRTTEAQAALVAILKDGPDRPQGSVLERSVLLAVAPDAETADLLVARFGIRAAIQTITDGPAFHVVRDVWTARLEEGVGSGRVPAAVLRLRDLLLQCAPPDYEACEAMAQEAVQAGHDRTAWLVALFPGTAWGDRWLLRVGLTADTVDVVSCASPDVFVELIANRPPSRTTGPQRLRGAVETLLQRYGQAAAPVVWAFAEALGAEGIPFLARFRHPDTIVRLVDLLDDPHRGDAARSALTAMSDLTLATLAAQSGLSEPAKALAEALAQQPGLAAALAPHLEPAAAARVARWAGDQAELDVATEVPVALTLDRGPPLEPWVRLPAMPWLRTPDGATRYPASATASVLRQLAEEHPPVEDEATDPGIAAASAIARACDHRSLDEVLAITLTAWSEEVADGIYGTSPWRLIKEDDGDDDDGGDHRPRQRWIRDRKAPESMPRPWILTAVQRLGGPACGRALFSCIVAWGSKSARYPELLSEAVDVMCGLPGDETLVHLGALARRVPRTKVRIELFLQRLARQRGLDPESLDEVLLPSLGLDASGRLRLDFGPRQFVGGFDPSLKPFLLGPDGTRRRALPRPAKSDDAARAAEATQTWTDLKKQVRTLRTTLLRRLESALRTQRTWRPDHFLRYLARHPLARHPTSALIWASGDTLFRVDESGDPVDIDDEPLALTDRVRLVHPIQLDPATRQAWQTVLGDYELIPPFEQLNRETSRHLGGLLDRRDAPIERGRLFALRNRGWSFHSSARVDGEVYERPHLYGLSISLQGHTIWFKLSPPADLKHDKDAYFGHIELSEASFESMPAVVVSEIVRDLTSALEADDA